MGIKYIPNIITIMRLLCSFLLLFLTPTATVFYVIYMICGATDVLDGFIARKTKTTSSLGAILDSISDLAFIGITLVIFLPLFHLSSGMLLWIGGIAGIRILSLIVGYVKYKEVAFLHTYANKLTGLLLFCAPIVYPLLDRVVIVGVVCLIASLAATEEIFINITSKNLDRDIRWFKDIG